MSIEANSPHEWGKGATRQTRQGRSPTPSSTRRTARIGSPQSRPANWSEVAIAIVAEHQPVSPHSFQGMMSARGASQPQANQIMFGLIKSGGLRLTDLGQLALPGYNGPAPRGRMIAYLLGMSFIVLWVVWLSLGGLDRMMHSSSPPPDFREMPAMPAPQLPPAVSATAPASSSPRTPSPDAPRPTKDMGSGERPTDRVR
jgi:hypothetical protein